MFLGDVSVIFYRYDLIINGLNIYKDKIYIMNIEE